MRMNNIITLTNSKKLEEQFQAYGITQQLHAVFKTGYPETILITR